MDARSRWAWATAGMLAAALMLLTVAAAAAADDRGAQLRVVQARLHQAGPALAFRLRTAGSWTPRGLRRAGESICLELTRPPAASPAKRVCVAGSRRTRLRLDRLRADRSVGWSRRLRADVRRSGPGALAATLPLSELHLRRGSVRWRVRSSWPAASCRAPAVRSTQQPARCDEYFPASGAATLRVRRPRLLGCRHGHRGPIHSGGGRHKAVALTFDDGPSAYTPAVMRTLRRYRATATFFVLGRNVRGRGGLLRTMLRRGYEIGNQSWNHAIYPAGWQLRATNAIVRRATGFRPCVFRPPYGAVNGSLVHVALVRASRAYGMQTVLWNVDPRDWSLPSAGAIAARVLRTADPGGIVVMHDGGGPRGATVAALPRILRALRHRGYRFATVTELLGGRLIWFPR